MNADINSDPELLRYWNRLQTNMLHMGRGNRSFGISLFINSLRLFLQQFNKAKRNLPLSDCLLEAFSESDPTP